MNAPVIEVTREDRGRQGRYVVRLDGHEAELVFTRRSEDLVSADHTGVPEPLGGRGIGRAMVQRMVEDARAEGFRILPLCSYVRAQAERHPAWADAFAG